MHGGPLFVSAISLLLRPHLATSDLPCYCKKLKFLHVACIVGSRVRVQAEVILARGVNFERIIGSRVRVQAEVFSAELNLVQAEVFSAELNFLNISLGQGFESKHRIIPHFILFFACLALLPR